MTDRTTDPQPDPAAAALLAAALPHVPFDGWSDTTFRAAIADTATPEALARALYPRGGVDLALAWHRAGDADMARRLAATDLAALRMRDRITLAVRTRLDLIEDKELVRRASTLFALPIHAADGARLTWATADAIWTTLGDTTRDVSWWTKRATLSGVLTSTVLYWLGDDSPGHQNTWDFLDRRIEDVMRIEKAKASLRDNPLAKAMKAGPLKGMEGLARRFYAPRMPDLPPDITDSLPGRMRP